MYCSVHCPFAQSVGDWQTMAGRIHQCMAQDQFLSADLKDAGPRPEAHRDKIHIALCATCEVQLQSLRCHKQCCRWRCVVLHTICRMACIYYQMSISAAFSATTCLIKDFCMPLSWPSHPYLHPPLSIPLQDPPHWHLAVLVLHQQRQPAQHLHYRHPAALYFQPVMC